MGSWGGRKVAGLRAAWQRRVDSGRLDCPRCGMPIEPGQEWDLDHLVPRSIGGGNAGGNVVPAHASCNRSHGARLRSNGAGRGGHRPW